MHESSYHKSTVDAHTWDQFVMPGLSHITYTVINTPPLSTIDRVPWCSSPHIEREEAKLPGSCHEVGRYARQQRRNVDELSSHHHRHDAPPQGPCTTAAIFPSSMHAAIARIS